MGPSLAGTDLSPSAVHALIEIEAGGLTARDLGERLRLEKSSVSRMLRKLVEQGEVSETAGAADARTKLLSLTPAGQARVAAIHAFGNQQVTDALSHLQFGEADKVLEGLRLYADALGDQPTDAVVTLETGYRPGLIADITRLHMNYYVQYAGFGQRFETVVAGGLAEFCDRLESSNNTIWTATRNGEIVGSVAIDGEDLGQGTAHLRWFIVGDAVRGLGVGRKLLNAALAFVDQHGFAQTQLWTFSGLSAARHLYEANGFACVEEQTGAQWGKDVIEQRFVRQGTTRP